MHRSASVSGLMETSINKMANILQETMFNAVSLKNTEILILILLMWFPKDAIYNESSLRAL